MILINMKSFQSCKLFLLLILKFIDIIFYQNQRIIDNCKAILLKNNFEKTQKIIYKNIRSNLSPGKKSVIRKWKNIKYYDTNRYLSIKQTSMVIYKNVK